MTFPLMGNQLLSANVVGCMRSIRGHPRAFLLTTFPAGTLLLGYALLAPAMPTQPIATATFELFHNRVYLPVSVNGEGLKMVLDSGAAMSGLSESIVRKLGLVTQGKAQVVGNGEIRLPVSFTKKITFRLGEAELKEDSVAVIPYGDLESHEGRHIDGVIGVDLFRRYVVKIDYAGRAITLYEPKSFQYVGTGSIVPLHFKGGAALFSASIEVTGKERLPAEIAVDSGTYSALRLYRPFTRRHHLPYYGTKTISSFGFGLGGEYAEVLGRVEALDIGPFRLPQPETSFSTAQGGVTASGAYDGTIGGEILRRFQVTFDYPHQQLILEPNNDFAAPFASNAAGLLLIAAGSELQTILVDHVLSGTPAETVGVQRGDVLLTIDGQNAGDLGLENIRLLLLHAGSHQLQVQRGERTLRLNIVTREPSY